MACPVARDLRRVDPGEVQPQIAVGRQAIVAAIGLGDRERDTLARLRIERLAERAVEAEKTLQRGGRLADETEKVGDDAERLFDRVEQRLRRGRCGIAGGNGQA